MDKLRAAATEAAGRLVRSRPSALWRAWRVLPPEIGRTDEGQGLAEYALILAGIAITAIVSLLFLGDTIAELFWAPINDDFAAILSQLGI